jgi:hypothetical protein
VVTVLGETEGTIPSSRRRRRLAAVSAVAVLALVLFYMGWALPSVGGSLVLPALIVLGTGAASALVAGLIARASLHRTELKVLVMSMVVVAIVAAIWTFQFALPFAVWSSRATAQAQAALSQAERSPRGILETDPGQPCVVHTSGSVGPLAAPYSECASWTPEGRFVTFDRTGSQSGGLGYALPDADNPFPDECVRHLYGNWYMFTISSDANDPGSCPIGYQFQGGG